MIRVLALPRYELLGASSRLRFYQYLPYLQQAAGFQIQTEPLLSNAYVQALYRDDLPKDRGAIVRTYAKRMALLRRAHKEFDLVWMEKEAFPYAPAWGERLLNRNGMPYVVDYDDATFHQYDSHRRPQIRRLLGGKIAEVMRRSAIVIAGNRYLADYALGNGASRVEYLPTAVDLSQYASAEHSKEEGFTIGWIGTPLTAAYLETSRAALTQIWQASGCSLRFVGAGTMDWSQPRPDVRPWSEETEVEEIRRFSVGIMPLPDAPFERGKCGYKLIQCMACGVPVVASPVGVNRTLIRHGENGFLAETDAEWVEALECLRDDPLLRFRMGEAARRTVEHEFCTEVTAPRLASLLTAAATR
ncbi:MAG: glycosyltransferase family 4 protein [Armatimonadota bacterium]